VAEVDECPGEVARIDALSTTVGLAAVGEVCDSEGVVRSRYRTFQVTGVHGRGRHPTSLAAGRTDPYPGVG